MTNGMMKIWGYKANGDAKVFHAPAGGSLPAGWSTDVNVITDPALRDGHVISERAGGSINEPIPVNEEAVQIKEHWKTRQKREREEAAAKESRPLRYDENNELVED
jgi:hypothetical protein